LPTRRTFLQQASAVSVMHAARSTFSPQMKAMTPNAPGSNSPMLHALELPAFVDPLPVAETLRPALHKGQHALDLSMREIHAKVHRDVPPTRMWSYGPTALAPVIEARSHEALQVRWANNLPTQHFLPIDHSLHGCGRDVPDVRAIAHVHGARVPPQDDGHPEDWFVPGKSRTCLYPLQQDATALWYHDHAMGLNRLNTYAGLFGMILVRDKVEDALSLPAGKYEVPLTLYDRNFTADGQLFYATSGDPEHPWVSEFTGDGILINGKIRPFFEVEPRLYRFRALNVANSRFFTLSLSNGQNMTQIGCDQGLLAGPVEMSRLTLAPAERADILIDFTRTAGQNVHLRTGALDILQFRVATQSSSQQSYSVPKVLRSIERAPAASAVKTRIITLNEYQDGIGNSMVMLLNRKHWHEPVTERPRINTTEIWEFVNETEDTHPMHLHLVRFQILNRQPYDAFEYLKTKRFSFLSAPIRPEPHELGWKDVVQCPPGLITRIVVRFEGYTGNYLYHCHVLEHEANDMMRPFEVVA
jgi:spore coat protein A